MTQEPAPKKRRMPGNDRLHRVAGRSPFLEQQYQTGVVQAIPVREGAPRNIEDIPEAFRKPAKPPGKAVEP